MTLGKKKKAIKVKEQLDDSFQRCSHRLSKKADGYKDAKNARSAKSSKSAKKSKGAKRRTKKTVEVEYEPMPLAMIPPTGNVVAPHLS
jgi:hypothetical protein